MSYFHRCTSTIIGAKAFHCPVRDGKEWDHLAMVVKRNRVSVQSLGDCTNEFGRSTVLSGQLIFRERWVDDTVIMIELRCRACCLQGYCRSCIYKRHLNTNLQGYRIKPHGQLVLVSYVHYCTSTPSLSTSWSRTTLQGALGPGIPNLQTSFPLRCLQRLSLPYIATRQCHWHDNRYTSGTSTPVLSY